MGSRHLPMGTLLLFLLLSSAAAADLNSDRSALLSFRTAVGRSILATWSPSTSPCTWHGVKCSAGRVTALRLPGAGLLGQIPDGTLGNLTALRTLSLRYNALYGPVPSDLGNLTASLRNLYLQSNRFSGDIPAGFYSLRNIVRLNLADNDFTGNITDMSKLKRLRTLLLESNGFSGPVPDIDSPNLVQFNVSFNNLTGPVPASLSKMPASAFIGMSICGGPLPACPAAVSPSPAPSGPTGNNAAGPTGSSSGSGNETKKKKKKKISNTAIAVITVGCAAGMSLLVLVLTVLCYKRTGNRNTAAVGTATSAVPKQPERAAVVPAAAAAESAKRLVFFGDGARGEFDLEDLLRASAEVLGKGTFGTTYKAMLEMGIVVAVKRLKDVTLGEKEFGQKIEVAGSMDHPNLVPLKAYYFSKDEKLLVYEYMPLGSLSALLHGNRGSERAALNWEIRSAIALGAARGVAYIHSTGPTSSHGNIKSSNILFGKSNMDARVSDHGLAHLVGSASSSAPARAAGYRAPEVTDPRRVSQKADVYSFGVLLLELLTGKAPSQTLLNEEGIDLPRWVQSVALEEWMSEVFDSELRKNQYAEDEMGQLLQLAIDCTAQYPDNRPSMPEVLRRIEEIHRSSKGGGNESESRTESID